MAEFQEVMKNYTRLCEAMECSKCPLHSKNNEVEISCRRYLELYPHLAEEKIMQWAKEHPVKTNADKFEEVFGYTPYKDRCPLFNTGVCDCGAITCVDCKFYEFWQQEYKEPERSEK